MPEGETDDVRVEPETIAVIGAGLGGAAAGALLQPADFDVEVYEQSQGLRAYRRRYPRRPEYDENFSSLGP